MIRSALSIATIFALSAGCGGKDLGPEAGAEGGPCFPNGTCLGGLVCLSDLCVDAGDCQAGDTIPCTCADSAEGISDCSADGDWNPCLCLGSCGDGTCDAPQETHDNCPQDCEQAAFCGDGVINATELCDGSDLYSQTCESLGHDWGNLSCTADCELDTTGCQSADCGNGVAEPTEDCDASDFASTDCTDYGFSAGELSCTLCEAVTTGCCDADLQTDFDHCGECYSPCEGATADTCLGGTCGCGLEAPCAAGDRCCSGDCADLDTSAHHCGQCDAPCHANEGCFGGLCGCGSAGNVCQDSMGQPTECCSGGNCAVWNDTSTTGILNCGSCGNHCAPGLICILGTCN